MSAHTPGPWRVKGTRVYPTTGIDCICTMQVSNQPAWEEDARLIAAAPDLFDALCTLMDECGIESADALAAWDKGRAAIAKATRGEA